MRRSSVGKLILGLWLVGLPGSAGPLPEPGFLQSHDLKPLGAGGFSALHLSGKTLVLLTDRGAYLRGTVTRDAAGRIAKVTLRPPEWVRDANGRPLIPGQTDTEALAIAPDGRAWISTEGTARVLAFDRLGAAAQRMRRPRAFAAYPGNTGFEALALSPAGQLYLIPEAPLRAGEPYPVHLWTGDIWEIGLTLPHEGLWMASDAAFDARGRLYLLERLFAGPAGFASRIRRFDLTTGAAQVVMQSALGTHDNLEGLVVWDDGQGLIATMVSDDNFLDVFRSELVEYRLPD